jgi:DNA-binding NarL/FixJ family response regulator
MSALGLRLLLADDHTLMRESVAEMLELESDLTVVGQAADGDQALALAARLQPDVALLDVEMPGLPTPMLVIRMRQATPLTRVIILSMHDGPEYTQELLSLGIRGYLHKSVSLRQLISTVRDATALEDGVTVSVTRRHSFTDPAAADRTLSKREREVVALAAQALSNRQIAVRLEISEGTVKRHMRNVFEKLEAVSRLDAVNKALAASLITHPRGPVLSPQLPRNPGILRGR